MLNINDDPFPRILHKVSLGGCVGLTGGAIASFIYSKPLGASCFAGLNGCVIFMGYFSIFQEISRGLRKKVDVWNSCIAGLLTGIAVAAPRRGVYLGLQTGVLTGILASTFHYITDLLPPGTIQQTLIALDLLDQPKVNHKSKEIPVIKIEESRPEITSTPWWEHWLPFRTITQEEAESRRAMNAQERFERLQMTDPPQKRTAELQQILKKRDQDSKSTKEKC